MSKSFVLRSLLALSLGMSGTAAAVQRPNESAVQVFKSPTCGCCSKWVDHMRSAGFAVTVQDLPDADLQKLKRKLGIPQSLASCHTALLGANVFEGHVPASEIKRFLKDTRQAVGLAVPGMPIGSPGMEVPGATPPPYDVVSFDKERKTQVFSTQRPQ